MIFSKHLAESLTNSEGPYWDLFSQNLHSHKSGVFLEIVLFTIMKTTVDFFVGSWIFVHRQKIKQNRLLSLRNLDSNLCLVLFLITLWAKEGGGCSRLQPSSRQHRVSEEKSRAALRPCMLLFVLMSVCTCNCLSNAAVVAGLPCIVVLEGPVSCITWSHYQLFFFECAFVWLTQHVPPMLLAQPEQNQKMCWGEGHAEQIVLSLRDCEKKS